MIRSDDRISVEFVPLERPIDQAEPPKRSQFRLSQGRSINELRSELARIKATSVAIEVDVKPEEIRRNGFLSVRATTRTPGVRVSATTAEYGSLVWETARYDNWPDNVLAIAKTLEALRALDRWGVTKGGQQYRGWAQLPGDVAEMMRPEDAWRILCELGSATGLAGIKPTPEISRSVYRSASKASHPDAGGDAEKFRELGKAADALRVAGWMA